MSKCQQQTQNYQHRKMRKTKYYLWTSYLKKESTPTFINISLQIKLIYCHDSILKISHKKEILHFYHKRKLIVLNRKENHCIQTHLSLPKAKLPKITSPKHSNYIFYSRLKRKHNLLRAMVRTNQNYNANEGVSDYDQSFKRLYDNFKSIYAKPIL